MRLALAGTTIRRSTHASIVAAVSLYQQLTRTQAGHQSIECINAAGKAIRPLVIHQGQDPYYPLDEWFPPTQRLPNWHWGFSKKGWTTDNYGARWFEYIFLPETHSEGRPRLLYMDAHLSHITGGI